MIDPDPGADLAASAGEVADQPVVEHEPGIPDTDPPVWVETNDRALPRRDARAAALEVLFAADVRDRPAETLLGDDGSFVDDFTRYLVEVVVHYRGEIDQLIEEWADGWTLDRMPVVDRNVLRLGMAEMLHVEQVPAKVAIDEAVELAKSLSTDSSPRFVNGVLAAVARDRSLV